MGNCYFLQMRIVREREKKTRMASTSHQTFLIQTKFSILFFSENVEPTFLEKWRSSIFIVLAVGVVGAAVYAYKALL